MPPIRELSVLLSVAILASALAVSAQLQEIRDTLKVDIDLVQITVSVTDAKNEIVRGLTAADFQLFEDKVEQEIRNVSVDSSAISLGVIFDVSRSMGKKIELAREAAITFLQSGSPDDEFFLVEFNNAPRLAQGFTTDIRRLQNRLGTVPSGHTAMYDAVYLGMNEVKQGQNPKKALLLITDGEDNHSRYSEKEIREIARESEVQIYSIDLGRAFVGDLSEITGGQSYRVSVDQLEAVCKKIAYELKNQYTLSYTSSNTSKDGLWRKVRVKVELPPGAGRVNVRSRDGYYAPKQ